MQEQWSSEEIKFLNFYLGQITVGYFSKQDVAPKDLNGYLNQINQMESLAMAKSEFSKLKALLARALEDLSFDFSRIGGGRYPYTPQEIRQICEFCLKHFNEE